MQRDKIEGWFVDLGPETTLEEIKACVAAGVVSFRLTGIALDWKVGERAEWEALETRVRALRAVCSEARLLLEINVDPPEAWLDAHPDEWAAFCLPGENGAAIVVSWASARWLKEGSEALARLLGQVAKAEWRARCVGAHLTAGDAGTWRHPQAERLPDIGPRMTDRFRGFALEKYRRNTGLLRQAWFETRAEFDAITCPDAKARLQANFGILRNPRRSRRLLDYYECFSTAQNEAALRFCHVAKTALPDALTGLSFLPEIGRAETPEGGHWFPEPILDSPDVDFLIDCNRAPDILCPLSGSLALRNKRLFHAVPNPQSVVKGAERTRPRVLDLAIIIDWPNFLYIKPGEPHESGLASLLLGPQIREILSLDAVKEFYTLSDLFHPKLPDARVYLFLNSFYLSEMERRRVDARIKRSGFIALWLWGPGVIGEEGIGAELGQRLTGQKLRLESGPMSLRVRIADPNDALTRGTHGGTTFGANQSFAPTITISDKTATRLGANTANKTCFAAHRFPNWTSLVYGSVPIPALLLRNILATTRDAPLADS